MSAAQSLDSSCRRQAVRHRVRWPATCETGLRRIQACDIVDVNAFGAFLKVASGFESWFLPDEPIQVAFRLPSGRDVVAPGTVRWAGRSGVHGCHGVGVQFDATVDAVLETLATRALKIEVIEHKDGPTWELSEAAPIA